MVRNGNESVRSVLPFGVAVILKLWLLSDYSITPIYAAHDDYLFVRQALSILDGKWLGPFDFLTLSKGPFFAMWLALMHLMSLPYILALQLTYLLACAAFVVALRPFRLARHWQLLIFCALWFSPASFANTDFRVERSALYPSLVLLSLAFAVGLTLRCSLSERLSKIWTIGLGASFAAFWLAREEGPWLLPTLFLIGGGALLREVILHSNRWRLLLGSWAASAALFFTALATVAGLNYFFYRQFLIIETRDSAFVDAYRAITRVGEDSPRLMVPISLRGMEKAASVSPAFAEVHTNIVDGFPSWRSQAKDGWAAMYPAGLVKETLKNDNDAIGGYFGWALLQAVAHAGYYKNAATAHDYYARVAREINGACEGGRIACRPSGEDPMPFLTSAPPGVFLASFGRALRLSLIFPRMEFPMECDRIDPIVLSEFTRLTRSAIACRPSTAMSLKGWVVARRGEVTMVAHNSGAEAWRLSGFMISPDVAAHFAGTEWQSAHADTARFEAELPCSTCELSLQIDGATVKSAPAWQWQPNCFENNEWQMCIDENLQRAENGPRFSHRMLKGRRAVLTVIAATYHYGVVALSALAILAGFLRIRGNIGRHALTLLFAVACILGVVVRAFVLAWVDVVSFPSVVIQYTHASYVLLLAGIIFAAVTSIVAVQTTTETKRFYAVR